jgi:hypothetical protein
LTQDEFVGVLFLSLVIGGKCWGFEMKLMVSTCAEKYEIELVRATLEKHYRADVVSWMLSNLSRLEAQT